KSTTSRLTPRLTAARANPLPKFPARRYEPVPPTIADTDASRDARRPDSTRPQYAHAPRQTPSACRRLCDRCVRYETHDASAPDDPVTYARAWQRRFARIPAAS